MALARALRLDEADAPEQAVVIAAVLRWLEAHDRWLLVYDNAEDPKVVGEALPRVPSGHVLITSRNPAWGGIAGAVPLDRWERAESIAFLKERRPDGDDRAADRVADALGDLPLALDQAAAYCEQTGTTLGGYADLLEQGYGAELWREPRDLERTVAAVWEMSFGKVAAESPAAAALLNLCAFFAPDGIPLSVIRAGAADLPEPLNRAAAHPVAFNAAIAALLRYSLARREGDALSMHRLVQAVTRDRLKPEARKGFAAPALRLVNAALPRPADEHTNGPAVGALLPHALATADAAEALQVELETAAVVLNEAAAYHYGRGAYAEAEPLLQRSLRIRQTVLGPGHPDVAESLNNLAELYRSQGRDDEAEPLHRRSLKIREAVLGPEHPDVAESLNNLALLHVDQGRDDEAEPFFRRSLKILKTALGPEHPDVASGLNNLAELYRTQGRYAEAEPLYRRSLKIRETVLGPEHPEVAISLNNLAGLYQDQGRYGEAELLYRRSLKIRETVLGPEHPDVATGLNNLAGLYREQDRYDEAEPLLKRALTIVEKILPPDHPTRMLVKENYASLLDQLGRPKEAEAIRKEASGIPE